MISPQTIDKVKELSIIDIIEKYHEIPKKAGVNYVCHCPWHKDKHPSFMASPSKNIGKCFVCDKAVNGISLVMDLKSVGYPEAIKMIANDFNIKIIETYKKEATDEEKLKNKEMEALIIASSWAADWYHNQLLSALEKYFPGNPYNIFIFGQKSENISKYNPEMAIIAYILERFKYNIELIKKFKIGYAPYGYSNLHSAAILAGFKLDVLVKAGLVKQKDSGVIDCFIHRPLIFPIHSAKGSIVGFSARKMPWDNSQDKTGRPYPKFINTSETLVYNKSNLLYGFDYETQGAIRKADKAYVVEGNTDKTSLFFIGVKNAVAKSGTALTDAQIESLKKLTKNICLLDDGDNAGQLSMLKNGEKLNTAGCNVTVITIPEGEDPDSFFKTEEQFREFERDFEKDYIIDVRAVPELEEASTIQLKKKVKQAVAEMLLQKPKEDRDEYIQAIIKGSDTNQKDWNQAIRIAAFSVINKGLNITEEQEGQRIEPDNSDENRRKHDFYKIKIDRGGHPTGIEIDERKFLLKLKSTKYWEFENNGKAKHIYFGFFTYSLSIDEGEIIFVQLKEGRIKKVSINLIKRTFFEFVKLLRPLEHSGFTKEGKEWEKIVINSELETLLIKKVTTLFEEKRMIIYPDKKINIIQDTIFNHYTFFQNFFVVSDKNGYTVNNYSQLRDGYVWDDSVLDREFNEPKDSQPGVFEKFVHDISGNEWDLKQNKSNYKERLRYKSLLIAGGYGLHNYNEIKRKLVILTQGRISEDDTSEGREGKTLFVKSLGRYMLNKHPKNSKTFVSIPGKDLKADDKHKWQDIELNTTCVLYDDPPPWISIESLYNVAEDSFKVEKKNLGNSYIESRMYMTTNRPFERDSGSSKDRTCVIELDSIFSAEYSPEDKYNHYFFRDWKGNLEDEWNKYYKYVLGTMLPEYFKANCKLLEPPSKNLHRNELLQKARRLTKGVDVIFWMDNLCHGDQLNEPFLVIGEQYHTKDLYPKFLEFSGYKDDQKLKLNFSKVIKAYMEKESITFDTGRDSSGTWIEIKGGLPEKITINQEYVADFFNNGNGYTLTDIASDDELKLMTYDFNEKYDLNVTPVMLRKAAELMQEEMPY
ncbi:MAG: CHC2 zinc finger domain-containing protein [Bacteroidales bacterium]|nr:CHC2 zinc finger domain-containing protein [Bacteroidales bacterium]